MYKEHFHIAIRNARESKGFTQQYVADNTGISRNIIAKLENGTRDPSIENLGILIDFYKMSADAILGTNKANASEAR